MLWEYLRQLAKVMEKGLQQNANAPEKRHMPNESVEKPT